jgi:putative heme-binding domain-containing protein
LIDVCRGLGEGLKRSGKTLRRGGLAPEIVDTVLAQANKTALDRAVPVMERVGAVALLAYDDLSRVQKDLSHLLEPGEPQDVQRAAVAALAGFNDADIAPLLLQHWKTFTPSVREDVVTAMLSVRARALPLLQAVDAGDIPANQIPFAQRRLLLQSAIPQVKELAVKHLGDSGSGSRKAIVEHYQPVLEKPGDINRGRAIFDRACVNCHRLGNHGLKDVGPNLATIRAWNPQQLLINILDPSREVAPAYSSYTLETAQGRVLFGLIVDDGPTSVTIKRPDGMTETILRSDIEVLAGAGISVMPENLETLVSVDDMPHLLAFLKSSPAP